MRSVVQRVEKAGVIASGKRIAEIKQGILVLLGIERGDKEEDVQYLVEKITHLRIFDDENEKMNLSLIDICGEMLVVSQFTLLGDCRRGRRPSFTEAEKPDRARLLFDSFVRMSRDIIGHVTQGEFQTTMSVELVNSGPVTMIIDSKRLF
jgi:D-tyrosyl-tRNA(Tyr) deacylase